MIRNRAAQVWAAAYKQALHDLAYWKRHPAEEADDDEVRGGRSPRRLPAAGPLFRALLHPPAAGH